MKGTCASRRALHALGITGVPWGICASSCAFACLGDYRYLRCFISVVIALGTCASRCALHALGITGTLVEVSVLQGVLRMLWGLQVLLFRGRSRVRERCIALGTCAPRCALHALGTTGTCFVRANPLRMNGRRICRVSKRICSRYLSFKACFACLGEYRYLPVSSVSFRAGAAA